MSSRREIELTAEELAYRDKCHSDIKITKTRYIACSSCGNELYISSKRIFSHPWIGILQCEQCKNHFKEVSKRFEEDKTEKYCYICSNNNKLYESKFYECINKDCTSVFCKKCLRRNANVSLLDAEKNIWKCFICNPKPIWKLRAVCASVMSDLVKRHKSNIHKLEKNSLPYQIGQLKKTKKVQKVLQMLCDQDEDSDYFDSSFITTNSTQKAYDTDNRKQHINSVAQKKVLNINLSDSSTESSSTSYEQDKQKKGKKYQKAKSIDKQVSSNNTAGKYSKLVTNKKCKSRKNIIFDDSSDDFLLNKTVKQKRTIKHKKGEEPKNKINNHMNFSVNESKDDSMHETLNTSKSLPKYSINKKKKKIANSYNMKSTSDKLKYDSSSNESEDDDIKHTKQIKKKISTLQSNEDEQQHENHKKSLKRHFAEIQDDSDTSSSKEFQKIKIQKVHGDKYSKKHSVDSDRIDHAKLIDLDNENNENVDEQTTLSFNETKEILKECKEICLNFLTHIDSMEQINEKKDEEQFILKSTTKINKLKMKLEEKQNILTTFYQRILSRSSKTRKDVSRKKLHETISDKLSKRTNIQEEQAVSENKCNSGNERESKDVSECDSEEIFSADETRTPQKMRIIRDKKDVSKTQDALRDVDIEIDEDEMLTNKSRNEDNDHMDLQTEELTTSPVLGTSKKKEFTTENTESIEEQRFSEHVDSNNKETQFINKHINLKNKQTKLSTDNETVSKDFPMKGDNQNNSANKTDTINESLDMFDISSDNNGKENGFGTQKMDTEMDTKTSCEKTTSLSKTKSLDTREISLQHEIPNEKIMHNNEKEKNQDNQKKIMSTLTSKNKIHDSSKEIDTSKTTNLNDIGSDEAEILAKEALLQSDSDTSDNIVLSGNIMKQTENLTKNTNLRKDEDNGSDVSSTTSTIILSAFINSKTEAENKDEITDTNEESQLDKKSGKENEISQTSDETNAEKEQSAKKVLFLESEDSLSLESEEADEKNKLNVSRQDAEAKEALLASSNSESFNSEASENEVNISKKVKDIENREIDSNEDILVTRMKKKKLKLRKNYYYKKDKKLRMSCEVCLERLNQKVLKCYSHALKKSKEYLEQKALKSLVNLDTLEKRYQKNKKIDSDISDNDEIFTSTKVSKNSNKQKGNQTTKEESLMDHLKRIENDEVAAVVRTDSSSDESVQLKNINSISVSNEVLMSEANKIAKDNLLKSSDSDVEKDVLDSNEDINNDNKNELRDKKKCQKKSEDNTSKQDDNEKKEKNYQSNWRQNKILTMTFSNSDSDIEKKKWDKKHEKMAEESKKNSSDSDDEKTNLMSKKKKIKRRILDSDSDIKLSNSDSDNSLEASNNKQNSSDSNAKKEKQKRKGRKYESNSSGTDSSFQEKKAKPKRKRIKKVASDSDSSNADMKNSQESTPGKSGRKNIRKVLKDKQVAEDTKLAAKEEEERLKRIAERQALYNEVYEMRLAGEEKVDKLVLDFDTETKEELVSVHEELVKRLKPHQAQGIKFMWDACFESLERVKTTSGSGCIIAHCMGLGKSLQVVSLTYTLLTHEATGIKTILIVCPLSTVLNWLNEYNTWLKDLDDINVYEMTKFKKHFERKYQLKNWQKTGGVMILGYEMFRNLTGPNKNIRKPIKEAILECLVDPGADLVVCDEGHLLKNEDTALSKCMRKVKTLRRIVLTGTPLQNNLTEYHCMVQFVKPNLLGTKKEFLNRFVNPITNGQFDDSTAYDVKLMKKRAHVLHKMLEGSVQRFDYSVLTPFLPPKQEYVIFIRLTDAQVKMYQYYLNNLARHNSGVGGTLFSDFQALQGIWTHPLILHLKQADRIEKAMEKSNSDDTEGSLKDFIDDDTTSSESSNSSDSNSDSDVQAIDDTNVSKRKTRDNPHEEEPAEEPKEVDVEWWKQFVQTEDFEDIRESAKLLLLFEILKECEQIGDKVLVFSQSLYSLTLIEKFLGRIDDETQKKSSLETLDNHTGSWSLGLDYFRLDGQTSAENRSRWCKIFNRPTNIRARLFLISTRAGGLGINLTAANRVIIFDASWNPSHDVQSIFRIYRFGQKKPCYVYRFLAAGTMEEKIYNRQVMKLSLSCRVVDEQQIERHYSNHNINELYMFESYNNENRPTLNLPKDRLLAEIFLKYKDIVENYHEHDSLLENKAEEELDEEERKQAWLEYEEEKKGKPLINPAYQNNMMIQQYNMMINSGQSGVMSQGMSLQMEYENLQQLIRKDYPNATPEQQKLMTNRALMEMYNYWEKQATLFQPARNTGTMPINFQQRPMTMSHTATMTNSNAHQTSQLNQLLSSGQTGNYVNNSIQPNVAQRDPSMVNVYRNVSSTNDGDKIDDDIIEVMPTTSNANILNTQVAIQSTNKNNNQEE